MIWISRRKASSRRSSPGDIPDSVSYVTRTAESGEGVLGIVTLFCSVAKGLMRFLSKLISVAPVRNIFGTAENIPTVLESIPAHIGGITGSS